MNSISNHWSKIKQILPDFCINIILYMPSSCWSNSNRSFIWYTHLKTNQNEAVSQGRSTWIRALLGIVVENISPMITSIGKAYLSKNSCNQSNSCLACSQLSSKVKNFFLSSSQICLIFICIFFSPHGENKYLSDRLCYQSFSRLEIKEVFFFSLPSSWKESYILLA